MSFEVVEADLVRDRQAIIDVWRRNLAPPTRLEERFDWYYLNSPAGPGRCWLLRNRSVGAVVGTTGLGIRHLLVNGTVTRVGVASDLAVDTHCRFLSPALMLQRAVLGVLGGELPLIYGLPNQSALGVIRRVGYHVMGNLTRCVKVLRCGRYLRSPSRLSMLARASAPLIDLAMRAFSADTWHRRRGRRVELIQSFDGRFDDLWSRVAPHTTITAVRDSRFLNWRYAQCPLVQYSTLGLLSPDRKLLGYVCCYLGADRQLRAVDLLADDTADTVPDLLCALTAYARRCRAASISIEFLNAPHLQQPLRRLGFRPRECPVAVTAHPAPANNLGIDPGLLANWCFLRGDEDYN